ncbi:MAG: hypothetical protein Kow0032_09890 [Methyloligellaceae bacterium]
MQLFSFLKLSMAGAAAAALSLAAADGASAGGGSYKDAVEPVHHYGWYVEGRLGGSIRNDTEGEMRSPNVAGANGTIETEADSTFGFAISVGRYFNQQWRGEIEWAHGEADDLTIDYTKAPLNPLFPQILPALGDVTVDRVTFNVMRSWKRKIFNRFRPYNGVGIGFVVVDVDNVGPVGSRFVVDDSDTLFAINYLSGFDWELSDRTIFTVRTATGYTTGGDFSARDTTGGGGIMTVSTDGEFRSAISAGFRFKLK